MKSINPATEEILRTFEATTPEQVEAGLARAAATYAVWRTTEFAERAAILGRTAEVLRKRRDELAALMTAEMGKPIAAAEAEVEKCAWVCDFYAEHAERFLGEETVETDAGESFVRYDPLGAVLGIMPWNFPLWQVIRYAAPALMAGNVCLLKHASNVWGCALAVEEVFRAAGLPEGAFSTLLLDNRAVAGVIADPRVAAVTLTGSDRAGEAVAAAAGASLKKTVLELGGSDPFIVLADADPDQVAESAARARTLNSGQSCIAAKRFIVDEAVADRFETALVERMAALVVGDPMDRDTEVGPLARGDLLDALHDQVERAVAGGARLLTGGARLDCRGYFYPPTVLAGVEPGNAAFDEETFGPVAAVVRARDTGHAVELANSSAYGLGASIWTADPAAARELVPRIEAGAVFINRIVSSDPRLPFGGVKRSGYGRELSSFGIREFVNVKSVSIG